MATRGYDASNGLAWLLREGHNIEVIKGSASVTTENALLIGGDPSGSIAWWMGVNQFRLSIFSVENTCLLMLRVACRCAQPATRRPRSSASKYGPRQLRAHCVRQHVTMETPTNHVHADAVVGAMGLVCALATIGGASESTSMGGAVRVSDAPPP